MRQRAEEAAAQGKKARRRWSWVSLDAIAPLAVQAVVLSEDAAFFQHEGVDTLELRKAMGESLRKGSLGRGASTITQQLAKNLWLSADRSLARKAKELLLAKRLEEALTKKRILALYLNVIEWGDGVYGIEAGAREHFNLSAAELSLAQSVVLASMLPAPRKWSPAKRSRPLLQRSRRLLDNLAAYRKISPEAVDAASAELEAMFGKPVTQPDVSEEVTEEADES